MSAGHRTSQATFRALADPTRVRILILLREKRELFACELSNAIGLHRNDLNWHMKLLERARLVSMRRVGLQRQYRYTGEVSAFHDRLIDFLTSVENLIEES